MSEELSAIKEIRSYILGLQKSVDLKQEENKIINEKIDSLNKEKEDLHEIINQLKEQIKMLKLAKQIDGNEVKESKDVKLMINEMVREIDKCITLLNK
jgi:prefoldin subunit 5